MSNSDSFIDEVTEEVKRDRLFALMRKYGWIAVLLVLLIVAGTAWNEYRKASEQAAAQQFGDSILAALASPEAEARIVKLDELKAETPGAQAILQLLIAADEGNTGDDTAAVLRLRKVADNVEIPTIYRQIASYKALVRGSDVLSVEERRAGFQALAVPGQPLRLLAEEQLALLEIEAGSRQAALDRLRALASDSEVTAGLRRRATQLIVALGGELDNS